MHVGSLHLIRFLLSNSYLALKVPAGPGNLSPSPAGLNIAWTTYHAVLSVPFSRRLVLAS